MTSADRQRQFRARMIDAGMVQINVWVPATAGADIQRAAELIRANPKLTIARLVDTVTGRLMGLKGKR